MARTGVGAKMQIEGYDGEVSAYISNDYLGTSQRPETKEAGINAVLKLLLSGKPFPHIKVKG